MTVSSDEALRLEQKKKRRRFGRQQALTREGQRELRRALRGPPAIAQPRLAAVAHRHVQATGRVRGLAAACRLTHVRVASQVMEPGLLLWSPTNHVSCTLFLHWLQELPNGAVYLASIALFLTGL